LAVLSALVQDAVLSASDMRYMPRQRRFALLVNRFRWEAASTPERVRALLIFDDVQAAATSGFDRGDADLVLSLLSVDFAPEDEGAVGGEITLTLAGDGAVRLVVECVEASLRDVTRPWPTSRTPAHKLED